MYKKNIGFTLIELSIVLTIIGFLIGVTLLGKDLIKSAELLSVAKQLEQYKVAINSFRLKYNALPGDMNNAESIWGTASNCYWGGSTDGKTCNGNGDGLIGAQTLADSSNSPYSYEYYTFWQQLSNSLLIPGKFSGGADVGTWYGVANPGVNVPLLKDGNCVSVFRWNSDPSSIYNSYYPMEYKVIFHVGQPFPNDVCYKPGFTPVEAAAIDNKLDDGFPGKGNIVTLTPNWAATANCATSVNSATATYNKSFNGISCNLIFTRLSE